jgi:isoleucyl-tRNA synthetase
MAIDYRPTVFLPQTDFPMRGDLPKREPALLERWRAIDLHARLRRQSQGREKFILHDGPPYANGNLHIGHALNKILKDVINRAQQMLGKDAVYVPGWDCHGLPIEWKIEEEYRAKNRSKDEVPVLEFRKECRDFASHWIEEQRREFMRLGVIGDWDHPYTTMSFDAEAQIAREIGAFLMNGGLYRGAKPVMWSVVEKTALAEAEIEYHDHVSDQVWVRFPLKVAPPSRVKALASSAVVIWTTTPWTLPGNRAIAYGEEIDYLLLQVGAAGDTSLARIGEHILVATTRRAAIEQELSFIGQTIAQFKGKELAGTVCRHPLHRLGYEFDVPLLPAGFVSAEEGTGFVHIAPGHGEDDYELGRAFAIEVPQTVADDGAYYPHVPVFAGRRVYDANGKQGDANRAVIEAIRSEGALFGQGRLTHSYPHSWRSKAPLIFRNTPQWFISMATNGLRDKALAAIDATRWIPPQGRNRIRAMIETRPDWCISRQRAWGVPIAIFIDRKSGEPLRDQGVVDRVAASFAQGGADAWYRADPREFLGPGRDPADFEQVMDIVDVWFESGATHSFVLEKRADLKWPASLYLEGSDQHRGWFHSSLLESCGTRGRAPYDAVLTHGFLLDERGFKLSKSSGNAFWLADTLKDHGADILRLWVVGSDYTEDVSFGPEILKHETEAYRRLRNTLRYLLGNLAGFSASERLDEAQMPELERFLLHRLAELDALVRQCAETYDFHTLFTALHNFCAVDLSAFYFDMRKDALYCDRPDAPRRRAARTVLDRVFDCLVRWLAPVLCFTAEEAWLSRHGAQDGTSVHLELFPDLPPRWRDDALGAKWSRIRELRRVVTGAIELERAQKRLGSSLQANVALYADAGDAALLEGLDLAEIAITSAASVRVDAPPETAFTLADVPGAAATVALAAGEKCQRCWRVLPEVGALPAHPDLCRRCADVVEAGPSPLAASGD